MITPKMLQGAKNSSERIESNVTNVVAADEDCGFENNNCVNISVGSKFIITVCSKRMETITLEISNFDKIIDIKKKIQDKIGIPADEQRLECNGTPLHDFETVTECNILDDCNITLKDYHHENRGVCLVISNVHYMKKYPPRYETKTDEENIRSTFEPMGYEIKICRNVGSADIGTIIEETKKVIQNDHKMLIVFVLSHGDKKGIVTVDGSVIPFRSIYTPFTNENFDKFNGKPKLFFFSCGQVTNIEEDFKISKVTNEKPKQSNFEPGFVDIFIGYASQNFSNSSAQATTGSSYVTILCEVIRDHRLWSVSDIQQEVQSLLYYRQMCAHTSQLPHATNSLSQHAYFIDEN